jgi:hypothetical protein
LHHVLYLDLFHWDLNNTKTDAKKSMALGQDILSKLNDGARCCSSSRRNRTLIIFAVFFKAQIKLLSRKLTYKRTDPIKILCNNSVL